MKNYLSKLYLLSLVTIFLGMSMKAYGYVSPFLVREEVDTLRFVETFRNEKCNPTLFCYDASGNLINSKALLYGFAKNNCFFFVNSHLVKQIKWVTAGDAAYHELKIGNKFPKIIYTTPNALNNRFCGFYLPEAMVDSVKNPKTKGIQIGAYGEKGDSCDVSIRSGRYRNGQHIQKHFQTWGFIASGDTLKGTFYGIPVMFIYKDKSTLVLETQRKEDRSLLKSIIKDCPLEGGIYKRFGYTIGDADN